MDAFGTGAAATIQQRPALARAARTHPANAPPAAHAATMTATRALRPMAVCGLAATAISRTRLAQGRDARTPPASALRRAVVTTMTATPAQRLMGACGRARIATVHPRPAVVLDVQTPPASASAAGAAHVPVMGIADRVCIATAAPGVVEAVRFASKIPAGRGPAVRARTAIMTATLLMAGARLINYFRRFDFLLRGLAL